jgi:IclR helix-turn-helix domain
MQTIVCICEDHSMTDRGQAQITISLSPTQVDSVVRAASHGQAPSIAALVASSLARPRADVKGNGNRAGNGASPAPSGSGRADTGADAVTDDGDDPRLSRSLLRGFALLAGFGPDGGERGIVELAHELGMSPSTAHRYALTLVELGLLERCPRTRKYRLPAL